MCVCAYVQGVRPNFASLFRFLSRTFLASPFSRLAVRVPCVLSRCGEDLTASLSSQQESKLRDRCAKFKARTLEKSSLTYDLGPLARDSLMAAALIFQIICTDKRHFTTTFFYEVIFLFIGFGENLESPRASRRAAEIKFNTSLVTRCPTLLPITLEHVRPRHVRARPLWAVVYPNSLVESSRVESSPAFAPYAREDAHA